MKNRVFVAAYLLGPLLLMGCGGGGGSKATVPTPPPLIPVVDNYNPRVGLYEGTGTLADGRSVRWDLVAGEDALLSGRIQVGSEWGVLERSVLFYDLKSGTLAFGNNYLIGLPDGGQVRFDGAVPVSNNDGTKPFRAGTLQVYYKKNAASAEETVELSVVKRTRVLGDEGKLAITGRSADCNATMGTTRFEHLETTHDVPDTKLGFFSAHGQLTQANGSRRFFLRMDDLRKNQNQGNVFIGHGPRFPAVVGSNPVQFSYYEDAPDGTVRQWDAVSGTIVFDAVDITTPISAISGEQYQSTGKVSFHFENLRMEPSNSSSDPRFVGAQGSFTLEYAGTSTVGYKRYSRDW